MNEKNPFSYYENLDSQRLEETFFTPIEKTLLKPEPKNIKPTCRTGKRIFFGAAFILPILTIFLILLRYEIILVPRVQLSAQKNTTSLIYDKNCRLALILEDGRSIMPSAKQLLFSLPQKEKIALTINFQKQINLQNNSLLLYLKNPGISFKVSALARDANFFSNALNPLTKQINGSGKYLTAALKFKDAVEPKVNLYRVKQITIYFHPQLQDKKNIIFIKDIVLVKNEVIPNLDEPEQKMIKARPD
jgi:hypothetical protein